MKVYLFGQESGIYLGEDFDAGRNAREEEGETLLPPPVTAPGEVAVFDRLRRCWQVVSNDLLTKGSGEGECP